VRQLAGSCREGLGAFGPHQKPAKAANPEVSFAIGQDGAPLVWNDAGLAAESFDVLRSQSTQPVTAPKPHHASRIDVHAVSRAVRDLWGIRGKAELVALAPRLTDIQSVTGRNVQPSLPIDCQAGLAGHPDVH